MNRKLKVGLVGARGYVGREIVAVLARHPRAEVAFVASRTQAGKSVVEALPGAPAGLLFEDLGPDAVAAKDVDAVILALGNGEAKPYVAALDRDRPETLIIDVSADHRFSEGWAYGLPEIEDRAALASSRRIANPGCYATAMALVLAPLRDTLAGPAHAFGVSGYSGAGATPSPRNDPEKLRDNLMPYTLVGHLHEREVSHHVAEVRFVPHVAPFFRGISMTVSVSLDRPIEADDLLALHAAAYADEPLVRVGRDIPLVRDAVGLPHATIGGFSVDPEERRAVIVATLDNLLKGAASQAVQNLNLASGLPETLGILS
jgi:N-acetyl-gamma-glutamyl-phosphate reductase common form